ncbi:hypothetical protein HET73_06830, partial [Wolbachia endosymbiont of Atemnus politus]
RTSNIGPLIAVLSSSILSFIAGQYLPYVITVISGSGAIAAVPLAIFAVSTVVALASVAYLVKLAVSRIGNKKEEDLGEKEPTKGLAEELVRKSLKSESIKQLDQSSNQPYSAFQEPQKFVCENCTNLANKPIGKEPGNQQRTASQKQVNKNSTDLGNQLSMPTPTPPPVTLGAQPSASVPPPPPPPQNSSTQQGSNDLLNSIKKAGGKAGVSKEQKKARDEKLKQNREKREKNSEGEQTDSKNALFAEIRGGFKLKPVNKNQQSPEKSTPETKPDIASILARRIDIEFSDSESEHSDSISDSGWTTDESKDKQKEIEQKKKVLTKSRKKSTPSNSQSDNKKGTSTPESGYRSDKSEPSTSKVEKPPLPSKPANLQRRPKTPPVKKECDASPAGSEMQDPSTLPFKKLRGMFDGADTKFKRGSVLVR